MGENLNVGAYPRENVANGDAIEHPERVVGDHDQRSVFWQGVELSAVVMDVDVEVFNRRFPEIIVFGSGAFVVVVEALQFRLSGHQLHNTHQNAAPERVSGVDEGDFRNLFHPLTSSR